MPDYVPLGTDPFSAHQLLIRHCDGARLVLDVGCSAGTIARELVRRGAVVDGIEFDAEAAREAEGPGGCRRVAVGDVESMDLGDFQQGAYDVVLMADLIEHLCGSLQERVESVRIGILGVA